MSNHIKSKTPRRDAIASMGFEDAVVFENPSYDAAIVGISDEDRVIYSYSKMVERLMEEDQMTMEDAVEFIDYNTIRALPYAGEKAPIVMMDWGAGIEEFIEEEE